MKMARTTRTTESAFPLLGVRPATALSCIHKPPRPPPDGESSNAPGLAKTPRRLPNNSTPRTGCRGTRLRYPTRAAALGLYEPRSATRSVDSSSSSVSTSKPRPRISSRYLRVGSSSASSASCRRRPMA
uniref:Uncharacterized protein n=1 Tax=Trypanosoma vivax (strain Y486) TaxID=1055687 RepID=G0U3H4_TRYVY|nr:hypothetical protein TVY486_0906520 [Trypanosoma vivax Y486]